MLRALNDARCKAWDLIHDVDTCGIVSLTSFEFQSEHKTPGLEYQSQHPRIIRHELQSLPIRHEDYTFIDFGCGKGRVLLVASEFPFRKIVGIEFVPQLAEVAQRNVKRYRSRRRRVRDTEVILGDATQYELPAGPLVLYFFSPFATPVMDQIRSNLESAFQQEPRDVLVLFSGIPIMRERAFGRPPYERLLRERYFDLYRRQAPPKPD